MGSYAENDHKKVGSSSKYGDGDGDEEEHCTYAMQLAISSALPMVMHAAVELDLLEIIAQEGPTARLSPQEIASRLPTGNPEAPAMLDRILQLLTSYSVLTCFLSDTDPPRRLYGLAPVAKYFVRNQDGASLGPLLALVQDRVYIDSW